MHANIDASLPIHEACEFLGINGRELKVLLCGPLNKELAETVTAPQLLACRTVLHLLSLEIALETALSAGFSAAHGALVNGNRLMCVAEIDGKRHAFWREVHANFNVCVPFIAVPADLWLIEIMELVIARQPASSRLN